MKRTFYECCVKRGLDVVFSLCLLILLSPLFLVLALCSKILIHGKVLFVQVRPGRGGKVFKVYKFKSMTEQTDTQGQLLPDAARVTAFGKFLRRTSLDELPQLWNILRGDMSFVGPRPRAVYDAVFYNQEQLGVYRVRPGLTGLAQVTGGRSRAGWPHVFAQDLAYQQKITFWGDISIVIKTIFVVLFHSDSAVSGTAQSQREYYYADYLLKHNYITETQYQSGMAHAKAIIAQSGTVTYCAALSPQNLQGEPNHDD
ncbi:MAG: sugar transferase [Prevotella sp.]|nr:sugar transferase [Prevotella sp.]